MSYRRKADVLASVKSRIQHIHGEDYTIFEAYLGTNPFTKKPVRISAKSIERLRQAVAEFYRKLDAGGDTAVMLNAYQSMDARNAIDLLAKAGMNLTLSECARRIIEDPNATKQCTTSLREAYDLYVKQQEGKSEGHQNAVVSRVGAFVTRFGGDRMLSEVTPTTVLDDLESTFLSEGTEKQKTTYNNNLNYIKTFMRWCAEERGFIRESPIAKLKLKTKKYVAPEYMTPGDVEKLFRVLEQQGGPDLAYAILSFFCAMRQEEIKRAAKGDSAIVIDLDEKYIVVKECKGHTRGVMPRAFTIPNQALAWMQSMPDFVAAARTPNKYFRDHLVAAAEKAGVPLPENAGRHTFCTMHDAAYHDANALSAIAGNTAEVRKYHYNGVAKPKDGRDYFAILPTTVR